MPKPEKHVFICMQSRAAFHPRPSCSAKAGEVAEEFYAQLEKRKLFDKVAVSTSSCFGPCMAGPSVLVYPEGVMYGKVKKEDVAEIFDQHLQGEQPVERLVMSKMLWG